ncbi:isocitrate lyase/phosphoenolpyruvate mutase family protein [Kocuria palustris]|uniref:isocitrate lyase/phosphoenolpyruvate mutase family protein n=1 Tax=Kocuria palustris TaxID=71999 RepID=UPI003CF81109
MNELRRAIDEKRTLVMPNAWDCRSAAVLVAHGFQAIGTSSAGVNATLGYRDHEDGDYRFVQQLNANIVRKAKRVNASVAVNVDFESGYGLDASDVSIAIGAIGGDGFNIEDSDHANGSLRSPGAHAEYIRDVSRGIQMASLDRVICARVDSLLPLITRGEFGDSDDADAGVSDAITRSQQYLEAGADLVFPIGLHTERQFGMYLSQIDPRKVNILVPYDNALGKLGLEAGVARISMGGTLSEGVLEHLKEICGSIESMYGEA